MSRPDCISNQNIKIITSYVDHKLGNHESLFKKLPYPTDRYPSPESFFHNENEWTTLNNFHHIFRRAKDMVGEASFYFNCGASAAHLRSWGRFDHFAGLFLSPNDGIKKIPFFNRNLNDTREIEVILPPTYDVESGKMRTLLKSRNHDDIDANEDYIRDPYLRGMISSIPSVWGLAPARVKQPLNAYTPDILFNREPEFLPFKLNARMEEGRLVIDHPKNGEPSVVGKKIILVPESLNGWSLFLGKYSDWQNNKFKKSLDHQDAILITETVLAQDNRTILKSGEIFDAPYFILEITYDRLSLLSRLSRILRSRRSPGSFETGLIETINTLRGAMASRNQAFVKLENTHSALKAAQMELMNHTRNLEEMVEQRTVELRRAQNSLITLNRNLEAKVDHQVQELRRYHELRRYLSPKLTEKILNSGEDLNTEPQRKMMTVLFSDIRSFSTLTEILEPEEIFQLLNTYISEMTKLVHRYDGTLNKIIGDGLLIFFGDPIFMENHAQRAVQMAIDMQKRAVELGREWGRYGHEFGIGIGINTGYMTVGNIGSYDHKDYTVIGSHVNVAARLESIAKPGQILVSHRTYRRVKDRVDTEEEGVISVKGMKNPVTVYNITAKSITPRPASGICT